MEVYKNNTAKIRGTPDLGTCDQVSQIIGLLQAPNRTFMYPVDPERAGGVRQTNIYKKNKKIILQEKASDADVCRLMETNKFSV